VVKESPTVPASKIETEQLLRQMHDDWVKALVRGDVETLDDIMADDFFFAYPFEGDDKSQFISDVTSGDVRVEFITREHTNVRIWGDTAVVAGKDSVKWSYQGRDFSGHYKVLHVYAHRDNRWQLVSLQAVPIP
jgi:ketosteroid isomerase-like protein